MSEAVELAEPNPLWAAEFSATKHLLVPCFTVTPRLIEHMGSTSVPGLVAKPIIDIIVLVDALETVRQDIAALDVIGFVHRVDYADATKLVFMKRAAACAVPRSAAERSQGARGLWGAQAGVGGAVSR